MRLAHSYRATSEGVRARARPPSPLDRAREAMRAGEIAVALDAFDAAIQADEGCGLAHLGRAVCLRDLGRVAESSAALERAVELEDPSALVVLARASAGRGDYVTAMATIERALMGDQKGHAAAFGPLRDHPLYLAAVGEL